MNKQTVKITLLATILVILIITSTILYNNISKDYSPFDEAVETTAASAFEQATEAEKSDNVASANTAKNFTVTDKDGKQVNLSDFFGKPIVANFWATWCYPCTSEMPHFEDAYKTYGDEITFLMVNVGDSYDQTYKYVNTKNYTFPVYHDTTYSATYTYSIFSYPMTLFINASGEIVSIRSGAMSRAMLESYISKIR